MCQRGAACRWMEGVIHTLLSNKAPGNKVTTGELRPRAVAAASYRGQIVPALVAAAGDRARLRFLEFFAAAIRNPHTRRAYGRAVGEFLAWCEAHGVPSLATVRPLHVATW